MALLGTAPHVADKILNHQSGTISGVAAVYQRHDFLAERRKALEIWGGTLRSSSTPSAQNSQNPARLRDRSRVSFCLKTDILVF